MDNLNYGQPQGIAPTMHYELTHSTFGADEKQALIAVINSDRFTMGDQVRQFETDFAKHLGMKYAVMVNSGSSANLIATASLFYRQKNPLKAGDEVIAPCISLATTFYPLHQYGLKIRFVDVDLATLNYDVDELRNAISAKTRMIVSVSVLGNPCPYDVIQELSNKHNLIHFDDNCESMGAKFQGQYTGTFGLVNTFSTFFSHHISTMEGGCILTNDYEIYCLMRSLRNHGWTRDQPSDSPIFTKRAEDFFEAYRFILPGYNVRPSELNGAVGRTQLTKLNQYVDIRRRNAEHFVNYFQDDPRFIIQTENGASSWFSFTMIVNPESGVKRKPVLETLTKANIEYRIITGGNILQHDVLKYFNYTCTRSTNARFVNNNGFFVGNYPIDIRDKIDYLYQTLKNIS